MVPRVPIWVSIQAFLAAILIASTTRRIASKRPHANVLHLSWVMVIAIHSATTHFATMTMEIVFPVVNVRPDALPRCSPMLSVTTLVIMQPAILIMSYAWASPPAPPIVIAGSATVIVMLPVTSRSAPGTAATAAQVPAWMQPLTAAELQARALAAKIPMHVKTVADVKAVWGCAEPSLPPMAWAAPVIAVARYSQTAVMTTKSRVQTMAAGTMVAPAMSLILATGGATLLRIILDVAGMAVIAANQPVLTAPTNVAPGQALPAKTPTLVKTQAVVNATGTHPTSQTAGVTLLQTTPGASGMVVTVANRHVPTVPTRVAL